MVSPRTPQELAPATMLLKHLAKKFRQTKAVGEALNVVHEYVIDHHLRNAHGDLIIPDDWNGDKGEKIVSFLASFSELAHTAAASSRAVKKAEGTLLPKSQMKQPVNAAEQKITVAMEIMTEYLDRGVHPEQLKEFFKGYHGGAGEDNPPDPTRLKLIGHDSYFEFPVFNVAGKNHGFKKGSETDPVTLLDLVESASLIAGEQRKPATHAQRARLSLRDEALQH